jgi:hypothetical protein
VRNQVPHPYKTTGKIISNNLQKHKSKFLHRVQYKAFFWAHYMLFQFIQHWTFCVLHTAYSSTQNVERFSSQFM